MPICVHLCSHDSVVDAIYTEVNAKLQTDAPKLGTVIFLDAEEARQSAQTNEALVARPWELWKRRVEGQH